MSNNHFEKNLRSDCKNCFGLCCVALPYLKSADFAFAKEAGTPCSNLGVDYRCTIHTNLRKQGFRGCVGYECFGAGQKVSQETYHARDWREHPELAEDMFAVFPIMQQLHEMLSYLHESLTREEARPLYQKLQKVWQQTEGLTHLSAQDLIELDIPAHRRIVNELLQQISEAVRSKVNNDNIKQKKLGRDLMGAKLRETDLRGSNFRGALLIAADLREADLRDSDFIGADFRDANIGGADLTGSIFLTQAQVNSATGNHKTKLPPSLRTPEHWKE